jgi:dTMP kinase
MKGKLIVFEGIDNTGKTSVSKEFTKLLKNSEYSNDAIWTCQPGADYGEHSSFIKRMCKDKDLPLNKVSRMLSFMIDRSEQIDKIIIPELSNGNDVICDRWTYSTYAYQLESDDLRFLLPREFIDEFLNLGTFRVKPSLVFYFPEELDNKRKVEDNDVYETKDNVYKDKVRQAYENLQDEDGWISIYPESSVEETAKKCMFYYKDFINKSKRYNIY